jgi:hypothetical protein
MIAALFFLSVAAADLPPAAASDESAFFTASAANLPQLHSPPVDAGADIVIPPGRPEWVGSKPLREGSVHRFAICSEPFTTDAEAERALRDKLQKKTADYIAESLSSRLAPQFIRYDAEEIRSRFVKSDYRETLQSASVGPMQQHHALLEFDSGFREEIQKKWDQAKAAARLGQLGLIGGVLILLVGTIFSYFRLDTATRGYYTARLQFMAAAAILAIVGAGVILARWVHWL